MKVELIAIDREDGRGIIKENEKYFIVRPPFRSKDKIEIFEKDVERALFQHGFESIECESQSIADVVSFLRKEYIRFHKRQDQELPKPEELKKLLEFAPDDLLFKYITRVREDFLLKKKYGIAETLALELLETEKVRSRPDLISEVLQILKECKEYKEQKRMNAVASPPDLNIRFPEAAERYSSQAMQKKMNETKSRGTLFALGVA